MTNHLYERLPTLAQHLANESWRDIDDPSEHDPAWHQWGVLEHTRRVWAAMAAEVPIFCLAWGVPFIQQLRAEHIQGRSKWDLLSVTCAVHDIGKWAGRTVTDAGSYSFKEHETISEQLIRDDPFVRQLLREEGLLPAHLDYVASVVGLHYEMGKLRQRAYSRGDFDLGFPATDLFYAGCETIARQHGDYAREIGLVFLADSLAKVEFRIGIESTSEIEAQIAAKGLPSQLILAAYQVPINIAMCRGYMLWLREHMIAASG